jgi:large subunit ribosomal protein L30
MNKEDSKKDSVMIAVVRVRGSIKINQRIKDAFNLLRLYNKNYCVVVKKTPVNLGMVNKIKDYVTWGEIDNDTYKLLV